MIPFEFTVKGPPLSQQAKSRSKMRWRARVMQAAQAEIPNGCSLVADDVALRIAYYYEGDSPDVDNIIKPIQDALEGVVYVDDAQVVKTESSKVRIDGSFTIRGASAVLLQAFSERDPFLHVQVTLPPDMSNLT
ncbi:MAG: RusA family crossover junction endodeoxyribonuclease [Gammaproteobacteria bacterium]|nr:RusA family crossover junction endodeoxyribonuclease [Gammaproteobacteria bacterium]MYH84286.1 RusA family crossover junction endodeoxyribonuclease [Gammaproteobacteria bacterium]